MVDYDIETLFGLTEAEAARRLQEEGYNELPQEKQKNITKIALEVLREPMFLLLVVCGVLYLLIGDVREAWVLLSLVFLVMGITFYQERKMERALEALRDLSSPRALVLREGEVRRISGREVVRGDILFLSEGDRVPADAVLLSGEHLSVDESILTGESEPVHKTPWDGLGEQADAGGDSAYFVYAGTLVVQGQGVAKVVATGIHTEMGKIGRSLQQVQEEPTLLQQESKRVVRDLVSGGAVAVLALVLTVPWLREIFRFSPLSGKDLLISGAAAIFSILWFEGLKVWHGKGRG